jgi:spore maturation protein CgeB
VYEICGAGALQLTNGQKELLDSLFKIDTELLHFSSMEELIKQISYIISEKNSPALHEIANRGFTRAQKDHTFNVRVGQLLKYVNN